MGALRREDLRSTLGTADREHTYGPATSIPRRRHRRISVVPLVLPAIDENPTILEWAMVRRLRVRANADTPEDAAKAREFGAEGIAPLDRAHVHGRGAASRGT